MLTNIINASGSGRSFCSICSITAQHDKSQSKQHDARVILRRKLDNPQIGSRSLCIENPQSLNYKL